LENWVRHDNFSRCCCDPIQDGRIQIFILELTCSSSEVLDLSYMQWQTCDLLLHTNETTRFEATVVMQTSTEAQYLELRPLVCLQRTTLL
jgi:hypothetical protein